MSRRTAKAEKAIAKRGKKAKGVKKGVSFERIENRKTTLPDKTGWASIHIPWHGNADVSWCGMVRMVWSHLICIPDEGDSMSELIALRVCARCVRCAAWYYNFTD